MSVSTLSFTQAAGPEDAAEYMWGEDRLALQMEQEHYERLRTEAAQRLRKEARDLLETAAAEVGPEERDRLIQDAAKKMGFANDPLPRERQALEALERRLIRSCGRPAVLVRPSLPNSRDAYHRDESCGLISGKGRHLDRAGWTLIGDAEAVGYRRCEKCRWDR